VRSFSGCRLRRGKIVGVAGDVDPAIKGRPTNFFMTILARAHTAK
jgi:hypothetical protein